MISSPKTMAATATVAHVRDEFQDDHVHCVLIVDGDVLLAVVERPDLTDAGPEEPAVSRGRLRGRTVAAGEDLEQVRLAMLDQRRRRLAVVDDREALMGLLCLKRTGRGFCSDADVRARAAEREGLARLSDSWLCRDRDLGARATALTGAVQASGDA
ncbi:MAG: CBS domain-containing protein [Catenulispora sp.]|nr:CBS domain-containing protein [Catenulispora sp.]